MIPHQSFLTSSRSSKTSKIDKNHLIRSLSSVIQHLDKSQQARWNNVTMVQTRFSILETVRAYSKRIRPRKGTFELLGFDFLIDENFRPWILEVNVSPDMDSESALAKKRIMEPAVEKLFEIVLDGTKDTGDWERLGCVKCG